MIQMPTTPKWLGSYCDGWWEAGECIYSNHGVRSSLQMDTVEPLIRLTTQQKRVFINGSGGDEMLLREQSVAYSDYGVFESRLKQFIFDMMTKDFQKWRNF